MNIEIKLDLTPEEAKELFVPSEKHSEFTIMLYDAYTQAVQNMIYKHIDPFNFTGKTSG
jgi:hypothetical protein